MSHQYADNSEFPGLIKLYNQFNHFIIYLFIYLKGNTHCYAAVFGLLCFISY